MKDKTYNRFSRAVLVLVLALALAIPAFAPAAVANAAAGSFAEVSLKEDVPDVLPGSTEASLPFRTVTIDKSKTFKGKSTIVANHVCTYIQLKGNNKVINRVNKTLKKLAKAAFTTKSDTFEYAKTDRKM
ncbi:MAG: hypothetical protein ILP10_07890, partial [Lachnospiraceae bacterium]|nr:hypothetical protein [Lachnospiraceae bacterium]